MPPAESSSHVPLDRLLQDIRACRLCEAHLPFEPKPLLRAQSTASLLIAGQAPGARAHESGVPWNDASGIRLRQWLGLEREQFYDETHIAIVPMGFCFPGKAESGDLPPRRECAATWHPRLLPLLPELRLKLLIGHHAQMHFLGLRRKTTLTDTVRAYRDYLPDLIPLPHPSPRNQLWFKMNPWFESELVPVLRDHIAHALDRNSPPPRPIRRPDAT
jgi:uracil-DNA glycosylase